MKRPLAPAHPNDPAAALKDTPVRFRVRHTPCPAGATLLVLAVIALALPAPTRAGIVFQADFNGPGTGTGTGVPGNIVTFGGTGVLVNGTNLAASIGTSLPLFTGAPGYLRVADTGAGATGGVDLFPSSAAHSLDSWFVHRTTPFNTLNGSLDFFFRTSVPSSAWSATWTGFRPIVADGGNGGLGLKFNSIGPSTLRAEIYAINPTGTTIVQSIVAVASNVNVAANVLQHMVLDVQTNPTTGLITLKLFLAPGNSPIDRTSSNFLIATATGTSPLLGTGANAITHAFNSAGSFRFGQCFGNDADSKVIDYGSLRIYDASPYPDQTDFRAVQYLPDLASVVKPVPEPTLPAGFDRFSPPVIPSGAPAPNTPIAGEWTRTANAGESIILAGSKLSSYTGADAGKDSGYLSFGQNGSFMQFMDSPILRQDGNNAAININDMLPSKSMYFIWARNSPNLYGRPFAINRTEAWWAGPNVATRGDTVSLYGRNLAYGITGDSDNRSWIYIKLAGAAGQWVTTTAVNPYKVDFTVPTSLANGTYEVWAHNGHGQRYGWSGPVTLTVSNATINSNNNAVWTGPTINVKTAHGAAGNGTADDTAKIKSALATADAAADYATVYFPPGTYLISSGLTVPAKVRLLGAGASSSVLKAAAVDFSPSGSDLLIITYANNSAIQLLKLDAGQSTNCTLIGRVGGIAGPQWFKAADCVLEAVNLDSTHKQHTLDSSGCRYLFLQGTTFNGEGITILDGFQCFVDNCKFNGMRDLPLVNATGNCSQMSYTNNVGQDYNNSLGRTYHPANQSNPTSYGYYDNDPNNVGWCQAVFIKGLNGTGARHNTYIGNNTSLNMGVRLGPPAQVISWGEQISFEWNFAQYLGTPITSTATNMTFTDLASQYADVRAKLISDGVIPYEGIYTAQAISTASPPATPLIAAIVDGTGTGQWRDVGSINTDTDEVRLADGQSWNVVPDSTSKITLAWYCANVAAYKNNFTGKSDRVGVNGGYVNGRTGIKGIIAYAGVLNLVYDSNTVNFGESGITETGFTPSDVGPLAPNVMPNYFNLFLNNILRDCRTVFHNSISAFVEVPHFTMRALFGNVYRNNTSYSTVAGSSIYGHFFWTKNSSAPEIDMVLFELNSLDDIQNKVVDQRVWHIGDSVGNLLFVANTFSSGTPPPSGAIGMQLENAKHALLGNTYSGFATTYTPSSLDPVLEEPLRVFNLSSAGSLATDTLTVWNAGTSSLAWSASSNAPWLSVNPAGGTVADENIDGICTITCNPAGLSLGLHIGEVTLTSGTQVKKAYVKFTVY